MTGTKGGGRGGVAGHEVGAPGPTGSCTACV